MMQQQQQQCMGNAGFSFGGGGHGGCHGTATITAVPQDAKDGDELAAVVGGGGRRDSVSVAPGHGDLAFLCLRAGGLKSRYRRPCDREI